MWTNFDWQIYTDGKSSMNAIDPLQVHWVWQMNLVRKLSLMDNQTPCTLHVVKIILSYLLLFEPRLVAIIHCFSRDAQIISILFSTGMQFFIIIYNYFGNHVRCQASCHVCRLFRRLSFVVKLVGQDQTSKIAPNLLVVFLLLRIVRRESRARLNVSSQ